LYCEALREAGLLVSVFASLDGFFGIVAVSRWVVVTWGALGALMPVLGIHLDPEV
jgi:hypothetical protein